MTNIIQRPSYDNTQSLSRNLHFFCNSKWAHTGLPFRIKTENAATFVFCFAFISSVIQRKRETVPKWTGGDIERTYGPH